MIYDWLKAVRWQHKAVIIVPLVLTALVGFSYVKDLVPAWAVALMGFVATLIPTIAKAVGIETHVSLLENSAAQFKSLQDRFRQLAQIGILGDCDAAEAKLEDLMNRLDATRSASLTPPDRYFVAAQEKIKRGDYDFSVDLELRKALEGGNIAPLEGFK